MNAEWLTLIDATRKQSVQTTLVHTAVPVWRDILVMASFAKVGAFGFQPGLYR